MRFVIATVLAASGLFVSAAQQAPAPTEQQKPTFRVATNLVVVDATVLDSDGKPVKDLKLEEFLVRVDGVPRRIASVQFVDQSPKPSDAPRGVLFTSNQSDDTGRLVLFVVDQDNIQPGTLRGPAELVDRLFAGFGPSDKVGLVTLPGPRMVVKPGGSRQQIADALKRTPGSKSQRQVPWIRGNGNPGAGGAFRPLYIGVMEAFRIEQGDETRLTDAVNRECVGPKAVEDARATSADPLNVCRQAILTEARRIVTEARAETSAFVSAIRVLLNGLKSIDAPKVLLVLSRGLPSPEMPRDLTGLDGDAAAARTTIHALRLDRQMFDVENDRDDAHRYEDVEALRIGLEAMVGRAGGTIYEVSGSAAPPFDRLAAEMSGYYLLGLEPTAADRDGKAHSIDVSVQRRRVTVKSRPQFVFEQAVAAAPARTDDNGLVRSTLQSPVIDKHVPVRIVTYNMADDNASQVRLLVSAELEHQPSQAGGAAAVAYIIYDEAGKVIINHDKRPDLERLPSGALRLITVPAVPAGSYTIRLATALDGRAGSVEHRFVASLSSVGQLQIGDLVLTDARQTSTQLAPPVDAHMTTDRVFGFVQIAAPSGVPRDASFVLEFARNDSAPALASTPLVPGNPRNGILAVTGAADVTVLPPGRYTARLVISLGDTRVKTLSAPLWLDGVPRRGRAAPTAAAGASVPGDTASRLPDAVELAAADVLAPEVLGPFVDEIARHSRDLPAGAAEAARAARFEEALAQLRDRRDDPFTAFVRGLDLLATATAPSRSPAERRTMLQLASNAFRETARGTPDSMVSAFYVAACYGFGGKDEQAANAWQTSLVGLDAYPVVYRLLADALARLGESARLVSVLEDAVKQWPDDDAWRQRLVRTEIAVGLPEQALTHIESMVARQPADEALLFLALRTLYEIGSNAAVSRLPELIEALERYRELYIAANGSRQALVDEWIAYLKRRT